MAPSGGRFWPLRGSIFEASGACCGAFRGASASASAGASASAKRKRKRKRKAQAQGQEPRTAGLKDSGAWRDVRSTLIRRASRPQACESLE